MNKLLLASLLAVCSAAYAQNAPLEGISESTDPAKIRDVERRADEIKARQTSPASGTSDAAAGSTSATQTRREMRDEKRTRRSDMRREHRSGDQPRRQWR